MKVYGNYEASNPYTLAAHIWGFKFEDSQHWLEYMIEYLNILAGFDYQLARGLRRDDSQEAQEIQEIQEAQAAPAESGKNLSYQCFSRLGLRRFVFYNANEGTRHAYDDKALELLEQKLLENIESVTETAPLEKLRELLLSFACIEGNRSWLSRSLFPLHEAMLFFEGNRRYKRSQTSADISPELLDKDIFFSKRHFYGRGGEMYYLMLSAGTIGKPGNRGNIEKRFQELLQNSSADIGAIATFIEKHWQEIITADNDKHAEQQAKALPRAKLGWLPDPDCHLYKIMAEDMKIFLNVALEPLEKLQLLAHLIAFHIVIYIYHRAQPQASSAVHRQTSRKCTTTCRLALLIDASENNPDKTIRKASSQIYQTQESQILHKARDYLENLLKQWQAEASSSTPENLQEWLEHKLFSHIALNKERQHIQELLDTLSREQASLEQIISQLTLSLKNILIGQVRTGITSVARKLAKEIGFVSPKQGSSARFTLSDNLLKVLTLSNVRNSMTYADFLAQLYRRYGLVIDSAAAHSSKLYKRLNINQEYYQKNAKLLLERMLNAGLAQEYSDATAMISAQRLVLEDE